MERGIVQQVFAVEVMSPNSDDWEWDGRPVVRRIHLYDDETEPGAIISFDVDSDIPGLLLQGIILGAFPDVYCKNVLPDRASWIKSGVYYNDEAGNNGWRVTFIIYKINGTEVTDKRLAKMILLKEMIEDDLLDRKMAHELGLDLEDMVTLEPPEYPIVAPTPKLLAEPS